MTERSVYALKPLRKRGQLGLFRGERRLDGRTEAVLIAMQPGTMESCVAIGRFENELGLADELDPTWAARPVSLIHEQGQSMLLLEDPGGEALEMILGNPLKPKLALQIGISVSLALGKMHRKRLIHKDLNPSNILIDGSGRIHLTGFGIASRLVRETLTPSPVEIIAGTLAYMSPEQTGCMNRSLDARSDLYSLGIIIYEMLAGAPPFFASNTREWIHCHIARQPVPLDERVTGISPPISEIVQKLLAKNAEDRYQTAAGVERDLRNCLQQMEVYGFVSTFPLCAHDFSDRLLIPEKLYAREIAVNALLDAFSDVVKQGNSAQVLITGSSGIGKSSVVKELHKVLAPVHGLFASGKFEEHKHDIPYATLGQAFQGLVRHLLGAGDIELTQWRTLLLDAVGTNGQLMVDLIPELQLVIGEQPPLSELPPQDAQIRFYAVFQRFLRVFAQPEHPMALFLDDLQWIDLGTLALLERLIREPESKNLLIIGAYRDDEVEPSHILNRTLESIYSSGIKVPTLKLEPFCTSAIRNLLVDTLHAASESLDSLAQLFLDRTGGNPLLIKSFLTELEAVGLLRFSSEDFLWHWDSEEIKNSAVHEKIADLMAAKLSRLPDEAQHALSQLACLGNCGKSSTLAAILGISGEHLRSLLGDALLMGVIYGNSESYTFVHDRVRQAAYGYIREVDRPAAHLKVGRVLASQHLPADMEQAIFEVTNHMNRGSVLIKRRAERAELAELNLFAGRRAKASSANESALGYLKTGLNLLGTNSWHDEYRLTFDLHFNEADCSFALGDTNAAERVLNLLISKSKNSTDLAQAIGRQINLLSCIGKLSEAVTLSLEHLAKLGVNLPPHPTSADVMQEYRNLESNLGGQELESILELPLMSDVGSLVVMSLLQGITLAAGTVDQNLQDLVFLRMANISFVKGITDESCNAFTSLGYVLGPRFGDFKKAYRFGNIGIRLVEERGLDRYAIRVAVSFAALVAPWIKHLRECHRIAHQATDYSLQQGETTYAAYGWWIRVTSLLDSGTSLIEVEREAQLGHAFAKQSQSTLAIELIANPIRFVRALRGLTLGLSSFSDNEFNEQDYERGFERSPHLVHAQSKHWVRKLQLQYLNGDYISCRTSAANAREAILRVRSPMCFEEAECEFYSALSLAAAMNIAPKDDRSSYLNSIELGHSKLKEWALDCPENFSCRAALIEAELSRLAGQDLEAQYLYEDAIRLAENYGFQQNVALGNELAARFYSEKGFETISDAYMRKARQGYLNWGALAKVRQLDLLNPKLLERVEAVYGTSPTTTGQLDLSTVLKAAQAVSAEIVLDRLIQELMVIAVEHAGAVRAILILPCKQELAIEAEAITHHEGVRVTLRPGSSSHDQLPESIVRYVIRSQADVILSDALTPNDFSTDSYISARRPRSILCMALIKQGQLTGVLYLENNLAACVFTATRVTALKLLTTQAAISLDNARLYQALTQAEENARRSAQELKLALDTMPTLAWCANPDGVVDFLNQRWLDYTGLSEIDAVGDGWKTAIHPEDLQPITTKWASMLSSGEAPELEARIRRFDGSYRRFLIRAISTRDSCGNAERWYGTSTDIEELKQAEEMLAKEAKIFEMISGGSSLTNIFDALCRTIEHFVAGSFASILLLDADDNRLWHCAAPNISPEFIDALDGFYISPSAGSFATAVFLGRSTCSPDIQNDPQWVPYGDLALMHGLRACWSTPLLATDYSAMGALAIYFDQPRQITPRELSVAAKFSQLASFVVERKRSQEEIKKNERLLAEAQQLSHTGSWNWRISTGEIIWSEEHCRIFGYDFDKLKTVLSSYTNRVHPDDLEFVNENIECAIRDAEVFNFEYRIVMPDGSIKHVQSIGRPITDESGAVKEFVGSVVDTTARKKIELEIGMMASVVENSPDLVSFADLSGQVKFINKSGRRLLGIDMEADVAKYHLSDFWQPEPEATLQRDTSHLLGAELFWEGERKLRHILTHSSIDTQQSLFYIFERGKDKHIGIATICRDISEPKRMAEKLRASVVEKESLLKEVHHRVKNNLQLICSLLSLQASKSGDPVVSELFAESRNRVRSMALVHENLYQAGDFSRVAMEPHIRTLCANITRAYQSNSRRIGVSIDVMPIELEIDRAVTVGLITNELVSNALKHAFPNNQRGCVRVEFQVVEQRKYMLRIVDDGVGLPAKFGWDNIGSLGLRLVHTLALQLGGSISVASDDETVFTLVFRIDPTSIGES